MSKDNLVFTDIEARMSGFDIVLTATAPDFEEVKAKVYNEDIKELYGLNSIQFMSQYGEDTKELFALFTSVNGIAVSE